MSEQRLADAIERIAVLEAELAEAKRERDEAVRAAERENRRHEQTVKERDDAEQSLSQAYFLVTGRSPEWSNQFGHSHALEEIEDAARMLRTEVTDLRARLASAADGFIRAVAEEVYDRIIACGHVQAGREFVVGWIVDIITRHLRAAEPDERLRRAVGLLEQAEPHVEFARKWYLSINRTDKVAEIDQWTDAYATLQETP